MATTSMTFKIGLPYKQFEEHPIRKEWLTIDGPPSKDDFINFVYNKYNINIKQYDYLTSTNLIEFESEQDYTLWILHQ